MEVPTHKTKPIDYTPFACQLIAVTELTPFEKLFRFLRSDGRPFKHQPGQFMQLSLAGFGEAPISVSSSVTRGKYLELGVRKIGALTNALHKLPIGSTVGMRGPFGTSFPIADLQNKDLLLIAGGCGLAPLRSLIQYVEDKRQDFGQVTILYGAKTPADLMYQDDLIMWQNSSDLNCQVTVDDTNGEASATTQRISSCNEACAQSSSGMYGLVHEQRDKRTTKLQLESRRVESCWQNVGLITTLIPPVKISPRKTIAVICGPPIMYKFVIAELQKKGLGDKNIIVSLERNMKCGVGKCGHCTIEHLYCCLDGPVFWLHEIAKVRDAL